MVKNYYSKSSDIEPPEHAFLHLQDITFRTTPGIGQILECNTRQNAAFWIPFCRIINIVTFQTDPSCKVRAFCQSSSTPQLSLKYTFMFLVINYELSFHHRSWQSGMCLFPDFCRKLRAQIRATRRGSGIFPSKVKSSHNRKASDWLMPHERIKIVCPV
jgi:hypothetical protein